MREIYYAGYRVETMRRVQELCPDGKLMICVLGPTLKRAQYYIQQFKLEFPEMVRRQKNGTLELTNGMLLMPYSASSFIGRAEGRRFDAIFTDHDATQRLSTAAGEWIETIGLRGSKLPEDSRWWPIEDK